MRTSLNVQNNFVHRNRTSSNTTARFKFPNLIGQKALSDFPSGELAMVLKSQVYGASMQWFKCVSISLVTTNAKKRY